MELDARGRGDKRLLFQSLAAEFLTSHDPLAMQREFDELFAASVRPFPDAVPVLRELRGRGLLTGVVSNGRAKLQRAKLTGAGMLDYLDTVVISEEFGCKKPAPAIFTAALDSLQCPPGNTAFVGDSEELDITGPKAAGMFTILLRYSGDSFPTRADCEVTSLSEILNII